MRFERILPAAALLAAFALPAHAQDTDVAEGDVEEHAGHEETEEETSPPPLLPNHGNGGFTVTTQVPEAQAYFSNGIELAGAFDHEQAIAAMAEAVRLDPECAMCLWGQAFAIGPTLNYPVSPEVRSDAYAMVLEAAALAEANGTESERALIAALAHRYGPDSSSEGLDAAYDVAMREVAANFPDHDMAQVLAADASMIAASEPADMAYAISVLQPVLERDPDHTPAIHWYIHATEIFGEPRRAEAYADRLDAMRLQSNHLAHMSSHTFYWVGRYQEAADANIRAVQLRHHEVAAMPDGADEGVWGMPYHTHNVVFGIGGAMMAGDSRAALMLGRPLVEYVQDREEGSMYLQMFAAGGYFALARFEDPQVVLELPEPQLPYLKGVWHYARGEAYAYLGDTDGMRAELDAIPLGIEAEEGEGFEQGPPQQMLAISRAALTGRLAMMEGRYHDAAAAFAEGAEIEETEDFQRFSDPPVFWYPVRRDLANALYAAGDVEGAIREAQATMEVRPSDPGALALLQEIENAGGDTMAAAD